MSTDVTLTPSQLSRTLFLTGVIARRSMFIWGPPGIGKSEIVKQFSEENGYEFIDIRLSQIEPTDLRGIPLPHDVVDPETGLITAKEVKWSVPTIFPRDPNAKAVIFLDEFNSAIPVCQAAAYQLVLDRKLGEYEVPENCLIIAAGNRETDGGVTFRMLTPIANRFVHFNLEPNFDDWQRHALLSGYDSSVIGYLTSHRDQLFKFDSKTATRAWQSPRSWKFVSDLRLAAKSYSEVLAARANELFPMEDAAGVPLQGLEAEKQRTARAEFMANYTCSADQERNTLSKSVIGAVGTVGVDFMSFLDLSDKLPALSDIMSGKVKELPKLDSSTKIPLMYSLTTSLCSFLRESLAKGKDVSSTEEERAKAMDAFYKDANTFLTFAMKNFEDEVCVMAAKTAVGVFHLPIANATKVPSFTEFKDRFGKYMGLRS